MGVAVIDANGFRSNVGIVLVNQSDQVFWAKRLKRDTWQFPQGGMHPGETPQQTLFRELEEEVGLSASQVIILGRTRYWLKYRIPGRMLRKTEPVCIGQKQLWFLLRLEAEDSAINLRSTQKPEFDDWQWVNYCYPLRQIILFKRDVYRRALEELAPYLFRNAVRHWGVQSMNRL